MEDSPSSSGRDELNCCLITAGFPSPPACSSFRVHSLLFFYMYTMWTSAMLAPSVWAVCLLLGGVCSLDLTAKTKTGLITGHRTLNVSSVYEYLGIPFAKAPIGDLCFAPACKQDPIVAGIVSHSGNAYSFPLNTLDLAAKNWYNVSAAVGCGASGDTLDCMRKVDWDLIRNAAAKVPPPPGTSQARSQPPFQATVDEVRVFSDYYERSQAGNHARIVSDTSKAHTRRHKNANWGTAISGRPQPLWGCVLQSPSIRKRQSTERINLDRLQPRILHLRECLGSKPAGKEQYPSLTIRTTQGNVQFSRDHQQVC